MLCFCKIISLLLIFINYSFAQTNVYVDYSLTENYSNCGDISGPCNTVGRLGESIRNYYLKDLNITSFNVTIQGLYDPDGFIINNDISLGNIFGICSIKIYFVSDISRKIFYIDGSNANSHFLDYSIPSQSSLSDLNHCSTITIYFGKYSSDSLEPTFVNWNSYDVLSINSIDKKKDIYFYTYFFKNSSTIINLVNNQDNGDTLRIFSSQINYLNSFIKFRSPLNVNYLTVFRMDFSMSYIALNSTPVVQASNSAITTYGGTFKNIRSNSGSSSYSDTLFQLHNSSLSMKAQLIFTLGNISQIIYSMESRDIEIYVYFKNDVSFQQSFESDSIFTIFFNQSSNYSAKLTSFKSDAALTKILVYSEYGTVISTSSKLDQDKNFKLSYSTLKFNENSGMSQTILGQFSTIISQSSLIIKDGMNECFCCSLQYVNILLDNYNTSCPTPTVTQTPTPTQTESSSIIPASSESSTIDESSTQSSTTNESESSTIEDSSTSNITQTPIPTKPNINQTESPSFSNDESFNSCNFIYQNKYLIIFFLIFLFSISQN